jgi:hypothetical protein
MRRPAVSGDHHPMSKANTTNQTPIWLRRMGVAGVGAVAANLTAIVLIVVGFVASGIVGSAAIMISAFGILLGFVAVGWSIVNAYFALLTLTEKDLFRRQQPSDPRDAVALLAMSATTLAIWALLLYWSSAH